MKFINPYENKIKRTLLAAVLWKLGYYKGPKEHPKNDPSFVYPVPTQGVRENEPKAVWINHSTFLISINGLNILTDPIWNERCSPLSFLGPKRRHKPAVEIDALPPIDMVLISHNHYDHLDKKSVMALHAKNPEIIWLVPTGVRKWFYKRGIANVIERGWWEDTEFEIKGKKIKATAVPTQHFSGRHLWDLNKTLWAGWVVEFMKGKECAKRLYFLGDTGYNPYDFKKIGEHFGHMDLSLIPIGAYLPRTFMAPVHIEPKNSVRIHREVRSKLTIGMHWKTFNLADEPISQPPYDLFHALHREGVDPSTFLALEPGHEINW